jgi:hypothetical protein
VPANTSWWSIFSVLGSRFQYLITVLHSRIFRESGVINWSDMNAAYRGKVAET